MVLPPVLQSYGAARRVCSVVSPFFRRVVGFTRLTAVSDMVDALDETLWVSLAEAGRSQNPPVSRAAVSKRVKKLIEAGRLVTRKADAVEVTHGITSLAGAAHAYGRVAADGCNGWTPKMLVWANAEGSHSIANLLNNAPAGKYAFSNIVAALTKAVALAAAEGNRLVCRWIFMAQTESDAADAALGSKQELYRSQVEAASKPITGQSHPVRMLTAQMSNFFTTNLAAAPRSLLSYAVANEVQGGNFWCLGPTYAYPWSDDFLHHTSVGHKMRGDLETAAALSVEKTGYCRPLRMVSASGCGASS